MLLSVYDHLTGRRLLADAAWRVALRRRSPAAWRESYENNPRRSAVVVCLTSIAARLPLIEHTLVSLWAQEVAPRAIRLHLAHGLPAPAGVDAVRCEDRGPLTKLLPAVQTLPPDTPLLVVDDDMIYPPGFVAHFAAHAAAFPERIVAASGWRVPSDLTDRRTTLRMNLFAEPPYPVKCSRVSLPTRVDVVQGYSGYLVRPRFFDAAALGSFAGAPPEVTTVDDVWISAHARAEKWVHPFPRYAGHVWSARRAHARSSLSRINRPGPPEQWPNSIAIRHFKDRWLATASRAGA